MELIGFQHKYDEDLMSVGTGQKVVCGSCCAHMSGHSQSSGSGSFVLQAKVTVRWKAAAGILNIWRHDG
jgi:hypothetical protein